MSIESILNYSRISDQISSSGQPEEMQFKAIADAGFKLVINLSMPDSDNALPDEGYIVSARRMNYVHIPTPIDMPQLYHLDRFFRVLDVFGDEAIWIHCALNWRVSAFLYLYQRIRLHQTHQDCAHILAVHWQPNEVWSSFIETALDSRKELAGNSENQ